MASRVCTEKIHLNPMNISSSKNYSNMIENGVDGMQLELKMRPFRA